MALAFLPVGSETSWLLLSILVSWLSSDKVQQENIYFCIFKSIDQASQGSESLKMLQDQHYSQQQPQVLSP